MWKLAATLTAAVLVVPTPVSAAPIVPAQPELRVITWNVCGEAGGDPGSDAFCPYRNDPQRKATEIAKVITAHNANVVLLQEICGDEDGTQVGTQLSLLAGLLGGGWKVRHAIAKRPDGTSDCRGDLLGDLGVAIAVRASIIDGSNDETVPVTPTGNLQQLPILCVRTAQWTSRICTTHVLSNPEDERRPGQLEKIRSIVWPDRHDVVLGGDFNLFPESTQLAALENAFDECDRRAYGANDPINEFTHLAWNGNTKRWTKRDHIFAARPGSGTLFRYCDADQSRVDTTYYGTPNGPNGNSDHAPLIGYLRTRTPNTSTVPGDLTGDGRADLAAVDSSGQLRLYEGRGDGGVNWPNGVVGPGWSGAAISHRGDFTGDGTEDVLARVGDELRVYPNRGYGRLADPVAVGGPGWSGVSQVRSVGDLTGDGYPDVVAIRSNQLYLYAGDPTHKPALLEPKLIGTGGWGPMTLTAPGDADDDGRPDLLARDTSSGVVYLYRGRADQTFDNRTVYGARGWTLSNRPLLAAGDADGNGTTDMWATAGDGTLQFYVGGSDSSGNPVDGARIQVGESGWTAITAIA